ncbi:MAG: hypothetical protein WBL39_07670 [Terrimicrobiaceae bacterium]
MRVESQRFGGRATFVPYPVWLASAWRSEAEGLGIRERPPSHSPVELTVEGSVRSQKKAGGLLSGVFCDLFVMERGKIKQLISYFVEVK